MRFSDLFAAGRALVPPLDRYRGGETTLVLAVVRGGVPLAVEVAAGLSLPLDLVVLRSLFLRPAGDAIRAARVAGTLVLDQDLEAARAAGNVEDLFAAEGIEALAARELTCRGARPAVSVAGKTVLLVDNGMRTGGTMVGAIRLLRRLAPARVIAAVPVAAAGAFRRVEPLADELVCLHTPETLGNVSLAYRRFDVPNESEIRELLDPTAAARGAKFTTS